MREIVNGSKRTLTSSTLIVDWSGYGTLFYRMSKAQVKHALVNGEATARERFMDGKTEATSFNVRRFRSGSIAIGCEHFNKQEVAELKKWSRQ